jgi:hypothetical protein
VSTRLALVLTRLYLKFQNASAQLSKERGRVERERGTDNTHSHWENAHTGKTRAPNWLRSVSSWVYLQLRVSVCCTHTAEYVLCMCCAVHIQLSICTKPELPAEYIYSWVCAVHIQLSICTTPERPAESCICTFTHTCIARTHRVRIRTHCTHTHTCTHIHAHTHTHTHTHTQERERERESGLLFRARVYRTFFYRWIMIKHNFWKQVTCLENVFFTTSPRQKCPSRHLTTLEHWSVVERVGFSMGVKTWSVVERVENLKTPDSYSSRRSCLCSSSCSASRKPPRGWPWIRCHITIGPKNWVAHQRSNTGRFRWVEKPTSQHQSWKMIWRFLLQPKNINQL